MLWADSGAEAGPWAVIPLVAVIELPSAGSAALGPTVGATVTQAMTIRANSAEHVAEAEPLSALSN